MMKVSLRLGGDRFSYSGEASPAEVKALIETWLNARGSAIKAELRELSAGLTKSTEDLSDAERSDAEQRTK